MKGLASGGTKLKIQNLHYEVTQDKLKEIFGKFGGVHSCDIVWDRHDRSTGEAVVVFDNPKGADEALKSLNNSKSNQFISNYIFFS